MNSNSEDDESQVMVMLPVGIGHVFVLLEENDWHAIEKAFTDPHVVDLEDHNGEILSIDLCDSISTAIVKKFSEVPDWGFFCDIESQGVQVLDSICWTQNPEKQKTVEGPFYAKILALIKQFEGKIYDTRAIGLCKSRIQFDYKTKRYNAYLDASGADPVVKFGHEAEFTKTMPTDYITEMVRILNLVPDPAFVPDEEPPKEETKESSLADLSAFDQAFCHDDADKIEEM